jgi:hypothetical protein
MKKRNARIYISVSKIKPELVSPIFGIIPQEIARKISVARNAKNSSFFSAVACGYRSNSLASRLQEAALTENFEYAFRISGEKQIIPAGFVSNDVLDVSIGCFAEMIADAIKKRNIEEYEFIDPQSLDILIPWSRTSLLSGERAQEIIRDQVRLYGRDIENLIYRRNFTDEERSILESNLDALINTEN